MMQVAEIYAERKIRMAERPMPEPRPGEVRIRVAVVGVCGSDLHYFLDGRIGDAILKYPAVLGHEPSGVVDATGPGTQLAEGDRVAIEPAMPCGRCAACLSGRGNICTATRFLATPPTDGIFCQYRVLPESACVKIPDSMTLVEASLLEPLAVGMHAVALARLELGESVAIFGAGPIGLSTLLAAKAAGAGRILMTDLVPERLEMARKLGADAVLDAGAADPVAWVNDLTGNLGVDATFEAVGEQSTLNHACEAARAGGRALLIGIPSVDTLSMPMHACRRKELVMQHVRRSNNELHAAIRLVSAGRIQVGCLATHYFPLEQLGDAFDLVERRADGVIRAMILPNGDMDESNPRKGR